MDVNSATTDRNKTALHFAAAAGHGYVLDMLIDAGAQCDATDCRGQTALHYASSNNHIEAVKLLLRRGALVNKPDKVAKQLRYVN